MLQNSQNDLRYLRQKGDAAFPPGFAGVFAGVSRSELIQTKPGNLLLHHESLASPHFALLNSTVGGASVCRIEPAPGHVICCIPLGWRDDLLINAKPVLDSRIYTQDDSDAVVLRGGARRTFGVALKKEQLKERMAVLRGVDQDDIHWPEPQLQMDPRTTAKLRERLNRIMLLARSGQTPDPRLLLDRLLTFMAEAHGAASTVPEFASARPRHPERIVRKAEDAFVAWPSARISVADLCAVTGVSKSALYAAFGHVYGEPPMSYLHKRRLVQARRSLIQAERQRGIVKRVALENGFLELGRFSAEYRALFGELPSHTLTRQSA